MAVVLRQVLQQVLRQQQRPWWVKQNSLKLELVLRMYDKGTVTQFQESTWTQKVGKVKKQQKESVIKD